MSEHPLEGRSHAPTTLDQGYRGQTLAENANVAWIQSPLRHLDTGAISMAAQRESRNREVSLPPTSTYRWWARRTEAVNGAIIDAVSLDKPGRLLISDPFSGGGVIPLAAAMRGHRIYAQDLNPWATQGLATMLALPHPDALRDGVAALTQRVQSLADATYGTLLNDGSAGQISHTFRVAVAPCSACGTPQRLYPNALVSLLVRAERQQPEAFLACPQGHLFLGRRDEIAACPTCTTATDPSASYTSRRIATCHGCGHAESLHLRAQHGFEWEVVLVERSRAKKREIDLPRPAEIAQAEAAQLPRTRPLGAILPGQETRVLLRHGFTDWDDLYPHRQRSFTKALLQLSEDCSEDPAVVAAMRSAILGSTEMAGLLSRWDRFYLKSYESMANHRFNFTTFTAEPNVWGTVTSGRGTVLRRLVRLVKSAEWLRTHAPALKTVSGPLFHDADHAPDESVMTTDAIIVQGSSERQLLRTKVADLVLTDPPYHDDVQYGELSQPLRLWAGLPTGIAAGDAVVNPATKNLTESGDYSRLLSRIFRESARTLADDGHLIFSYANRDPGAWVELINALQSAGLRAVGCEIVHSENETDHAKRGVRSCTLDLIIDLVTVGPTPITKHRPAPVETEEGAFLEQIADAVLSVGILKDGWHEEFLATISRAPFLAQILPKPRPGEAPESVPPAEG